jgi:hypothetical protein
MVGFLIVQILFLILQQVTKCQYIPDSIFFRFALVVRTLLECSLNRWQHCALHRLLEISCLLTILFKRLEGQGGEHASEFYFGWLRGDSLQSVVLKIRSTDSWTENSPIFCFNALKLGDGFIQVLIIPAHVRFNTVCTSLAVTLHFLTEFEVILLMLTLLK